MGAGTTGCAPPLLPAPPVPPSRVRAPLAQVCGTFTPFRSLLQPYLQEAPPALPDRKGVQKPPLEVRHAARVAVMRLSYLLHLRHPASAISDLLNVVASVLDERLDRDADSAGGGGDGGAPAVLWAATEPPTLSLNPGSPCDLALQCECGLELAQLPELLHLFEFSGIARLGPGSWPSGCLACLACTLLVAGPSQRPRRRGAHAPSPPSGACRAQQRDGGRGGRRVGSA